MKKLALVLFVSTLLLTASSCKKCYTCSKQEYTYCATMHIITPFFTNDVTQCFADSNQRSQFIQTTQSGVSQIGSANVTNQSDSLVFDRSEDICGNKKEADNFKLLWENDGYTCTDK